MTKSQRVPGRRAPEQQAEDERIRAQFADQPSLEDLVTSGELEIDELNISSAVGSLADAIPLMRAERKRRGLSAQEVSRMSGIAQAALSRLESGENTNPTFSTLAKYAMAVGFQIKMISEAEARSASQPGAATADEAEILKLVRLLGPDEARRRLLMVAAEPIR